jgi:hypothetical protein
MERHDHEDPDVCPAQLDNSGPAVPPVFVRGDAAADAGNNLADEMERRIRRWGSDVQGGGASIVSLKTLPKLAKQLPLLPIYLKQLQVQTKHKGVVSTTLQVTHSLSDIVRRLAVLQQTSFDFMTFAAKTGLYQTNLWHGEVWRDSPLFTHHRILGGDGHYHVLGTLAA